MKIIALEEHFATPDILAAWQELNGELQDLALKPASSESGQRKLLDFAEERLNCMDESGVDVQVLSLTTPGVQNLPSEKAVTLSRKVNDHVADIVSKKRAFPGVCGSSNSQARCGSS